MANAVFIHRVFNAKFTNFLLKYHIIYPVLSFFSWLLHKVRPKLDNEFNISGKNRCYHPPCLEKFPARLQKSSFPNLLLRQGRNGSPKIKRNILYMAANGVFNLKNPKATNPTRPCFGKIAFQQTPTASDARKNDPRARIYIIMCIRGFENLRTVVPALHGKKQDCRHCEAQKGKAFFNVKRRKTYINLNAPQKTGKQ